MRDYRPYLEKGTTRDELIVTIHGFGSGLKPMLGAREVIRESRPGADVFAPMLPVARNRLTRVKAEVIVAELIDQIEAIVADRGGPGYRSITFVGHSFGAVLARKIAIIAFGEQTDARGRRQAPFEPEFQRFKSPRRWAPSIRRIVLLAGMNRGWSVSSAMDWLTTTWWSVLQLVGETVFKGRATIFAIRRGAPFLVQTRLQWLALMNPEYGRQPNLIVVQLLGTQDDKVAPDDNVDYSVDQFGGEKQQRYFYLEVGQSNHDNVVMMSETGRAKDAAARSERRTMFLIALNAGAAELATLCITREQMSDNLPPEPDLNVTDMVFVIHGIRDKGFWTQKIARTIKRHVEAENRATAAHGPPRKFESWTESYGYFAMLPFMLRPVRQRKVEWLMDNFAEARARFPRATFHYVGHSNGTYLAAQALNDYPAASFGNIVFAGSVVRRDYDWLRLIPEPGNPNPPDTQRVNAVLNYVATRDWVVALFPKGVQWRRSINLGSAGHDGFDQASPEGPVYQIDYIAGSHGAGHEEPNWETIAKFVVTGAAPEISYPPYVRQQNRALRAAAKWSAVVLPLAIVGALGVAGVILWPYTQDLWCHLSAVWSGAPRSSCVLSVSPNEVAARVLGFCAYLLVVVTVVTRF